MNIREIAEDDVHGSETLSLELIDACMEIFSRKKDAGSEIQYLVEKKYEMVQLMNVLKIMKRFRSEHEFIDLKKEMERAFSNALSNSDRIPSMKSVVTISWSKLVQESIVRNRDRIEEISVFESRPKNEGVQFAEYLSDLGFKVNLYMDSSIYHALDGEKTVLVGMDAILPRLELVNKSGTFPLAIASRIKGSRFYAMGTRFKVADNYYSFINHPMDEYSGRKFSVKNFYFDVTPPEYIDGYIFDFGFFEKGSFELLATTLHTLEAELFQ